jgi:hypothetical protein
VYRKKRRCEKRQAITTIVCYSNDCTAVTGSYDATVENITRPNREKRASLEVNRTEIHQKIAPTHHEMESESIDDTAVRPMSKV